MSEQNQYVSPPIEGLLGRIVRNFSWTVASEFLSKGANFFMYLYLGRVLGVEKFGLFVGIQAAVYYVSLAVDLGTNMYGIKEISRNRENPENIICSLLGLRITAGIIAYTIFITIVWSLDFTIEVQLIWSAAGFYLITYAFYIDWILKGLERFSFIAFGNMGIGVTLLLGLIIFVKHPEDVALGDIVWSGSPLVGSIILWWLLKKKIGLRLKPSFVIADWLRHLRASIFFTLSGALGMLYQYLPILLLGLFFGAYEIGLFSAPYRISFAFCTLGFFLPMSFYPVLAHQYANNTEDFFLSVYRLRGIMLSVGLFIGLSCYFVRQQMVTLFFGDAYSESIRLFAILVWLIPLYFLRYSFGIPLNAMGKQRLVAYSVGLSLFVMVFSGVPLIKAFGPTGASMAIVISEVVTVVAMALFFCKITNCSLQHLFMKR